MYGETTDVRLDLVTPEGEFREASKRDLRAFDRAWEQIVAVHTTDEEYDEWPQ